MSDNTIEDLAKQIGCKPEEIVELSMDEFEECKLLRENAIHHTDLKQMVEDIRAHVKQHNETHDDDIEIESMDLIDEMKFGYVDKTNKKMWTILIKDFRSDDPETNRLLQLVTRSQEGKKNFNEMLSMAKE